VLGRNTAQRQVQENWAEISQLAAEEGTRPTPTGLFFGQRSLLRHLGLSSIQAFVHEESGNTILPEAQVTAGRKSSHIDQLQRSKASSSHEGACWYARQRRGGPALLLLMWQRLPAEGRQSAHDSFFQEMLQTIVTMPLVGMNVERRGGGAAMLGTLCVGCQRRVLPRTKPAGASCVRREPFWKDFRGGRAKWLPGKLLSPGILSACDGDQPCLQPKRGPVFLPGRKMAKTIPKGSIPVRD